MTKLQRLRPALAKQHSWSQPPASPQGRPPMTRQSKRAVTLGACIACRKRKSKCSGLRPVCACCAQKGTECVYERNRSERPLQAAIRKNNEIEAELSNLRQLYDFLRLRPEQEASVMFRRIRTAPSHVNSSQHIQELAEFIRNDGPSLAALAIGQQSQPIRLPPIHKMVGSSHLGASHSSDGLP